MSKPTITNQITFLPTTNLDNTADFYENTLGFRLVVDQGTCRIYSSSQEGYIGFCLRAETAAASAVIITLVTDEVDQWAAYLQTKGVNIETPPAVNPQYNIYHFFFNDPNGYKIEIQSFLHPFDKA